MAENEVLTRIKSQVIDYDDVLQAVYDFQEEEWHRSPMDWDTKAEQRSKIQAEIAGKFKYKFSHDATLFHDPFTEEARKRLIEWIQTVRENIKAGIEQGHCKDKQSLKRMLKIPPGEPFKGATIHITSLWHSLVNEPLEIQFPADEPISDENFYSIHLETGEILYSGKHLIRLTPKPRQVFDLLAKQYPKYVSTPEILISCWKDKPGSGEGVVKSTMQKIKKAFSKFDDDVWESEMGKGYRLKLRYQI